MTRGENTGAAVLKDDVAGPVTRIPVSEARVQRVRFLTLVAIAAMLLFPALRRPGLAGYDDCFFSHEAKQMVSTGDWGNVRLNGQIILQIPPVFLWLQASSFKVFGVNDAAGSVEDLASRVDHAQAATVIVDRASYGKLLPMLSSIAPRIVGESETDLFSDGVRSRPSLVKATDPWKPPGSYPRQRLARVGTTNARPAQTRAVPT